jgi:hypothetical protein
MKAESGNKNRSRMKRIFSPIVIPLSALLLWSVAPAYALTVGEILSLKKAGVSEETIQMLLEREREERALALRAGTWKTGDGRVVYSTEGNATTTQPYQEVYPLCIYPQIDAPRRREKK